MKPWPLAAEHTERQAVCPGNPYLLEVDVDARNSSTTFSRGTGPRLKTISCGYWQENTVVADTGGWSWMSPRG
jgi:hypothetical protein